MNARDSRNDQRVNGRLAAAAHHYVRVAVAHEAVPETDRVQTGRGGGNRGHIGALLGDIRHTSEK